LPAVEIDQNPDTEKSGFEVSPSEPDLSISEAGVAITTVLIREMTRKTADEIQQKESHPEGKNEGFPEKEIEVGMMRDVTDETFLEKTETRI
jgi:hypothetical protein